MHVIELIQKKRDNKTLCKAEIDFLINNFSHNIIPNYQMSAFLMATFINGMNDEEISYLTNAMLYSGKVATHQNPQGPIIDKHSTGGVGDKISIPLAPAMASCGLVVPMIAGRGLGHTGGTLDKLEAIPGFRCDLSLEQYVAQVAKIGCVIMGQTKEIAPADKLIYALRDVSGSVESIPLISSSILSKKLAEGLDGLVLDVKFGSGAFMKELDKARTLASCMVAIGTHMGKKVSAVLTNMDQPLGTMIGNALEIIESIEILHGRGPQDSMDLTLDLGAEMLLLAGRVSSLEAGRAIVLESLKSGQAFQKFLQMVEAQGGDTSYILDPARFNIAPRKIIIKAPIRGYISAINCQEVGLASGILGGGRMSLGDKIDFSVGIEMLAKIGDFVEQDQELCVIYANAQGIEEATQRIKNAFQISLSAVSKPILCAERISTY